MARLVVVLAIFIAAAAIAWPAGAQAPQAEAVPPATGPVTVSQMIMNAGYTLTPDEIVYLDADEQYMERYVTAILAVDMQAAFVNEPSIRQVVTDQLRQVVALDPSGGPRPPASMQALHQVGQARRSAIQRAARGWLEGLEANDPYWVNRGAEAYGQARQGEADWYSALRERLLAQANNPQQPATPAQAPR